MSKFVGKNDDSGTPLVSDANVFVAYDWSKPVIELFNWALSYAKSHAGASFWIDLFNSQV